MAKDGTVRGGARAGSGRRAKSLLEKLDTGNPGGRKLTVMELPPGTDPSSTEMPEVKDYMRDSQADGEFDAEEIFRETWQWIQARGCGELVSPQTIRNYAMSVARWIQCEKAVSKYGFLGKHPTTGAPMLSPYVTMARIT